VVLTPAGTQVKNANGTDTVAYTVTVTNGLGAVVGDTVRVMLTPSVSGACGTSSSTFLTTNASGQATFTYTTSTTAGNCTVQGTDAFGNTTSANTTVVQQNQVPNNMSVTANPSSVSVAAGTTSTVTATVTNGVSGTAVSGDSVGFAVTGAGCGTVSPSPVVTNAVGQSATTYTPGATAGVFCTVTATEAGTGKTATVTITQTT